MKTFPSVLFFFILLVSCNVLPAQTTFRNSTPIEIPYSDDAPVLGNPYPSEIVVTGIKGTISKVTVNIYGLDHNYPDALDVLLVAPDGTGIIILSDVGGAYDLPNSGTGINVTLDDDAAAFIPDNVPYQSGTYKITNKGARTDMDLWPDAPVPSTATTLAGFNGYGANGVWRLFVVNDAEGSVGYIHNGWSLTLTTENTSLPVRYSAFSANYQTGDQAVLLKWTTEMEENSHAFVVESSHNGVEWKTVAHVAAAGNASKSKNYQYLDGAQPQGVVYYRLKMVDKDGRTEYTKTVSASVPARPAATANAYFNAAQAAIVLHTGALQGRQALVQLFDLNGRLIARQQKSLTLPTQEVLTIPGLNDGLYVLKVVSGKELLVQKIMIRRY